MTVQELIKWLETQDQGATVEILIGERGNYYGDKYYTADFNSEEHVYYTDMRGNKFAVGKPYENSRTLFLGSAE